MFSFVLNKFQQLPPQGQSALTWQTAIQIREESLRQQRFQGRYNPILKLKFVFLFIQSEIPDFPLRLLQWNTEEKSLGRVE